MTPLSEYIVAYTGPRDVKLEDEAIRLTENHKKKNLFSVAVWSWEDIKLRLADHPGLLRKHYPDQFGSTIAAELISKEIASTVTVETERFRRKLVKN